jgi:Icc-related predicted phosphoesterase
VLLTHAPPAGLGDGEDPPHRGVEALHALIETLRPTWHLHGHVHPYGRPAPDRAAGPTTVANVIPYRMLEIEPRSAHRV